MNSLKYMDMYVYSLTTRRSRLLVVNMVNVQHALLGHMTRNQISEDRMT